MDQAATVAHILLAGQEDESREDTEKFLVKAGLKFDFVSDGQRALQAADDIRYDLVITDLALPGLNGIDLLRAIKQRKPEQAIIVTSASKNIDLALEVLREGVSDYLQKPLDFDSLARSVERTLSEVRLREDRDRLFRYVREQFTEYTCTSAELVGQRFPLMIVEKLFRAGRIDLDTKLKIELGFQEALVNSLEHGNLELKSEWKEQFNHEGIDRYTSTKRERLQDPHFSQRLIRLRIQLARNILSINIKDEGPGFLYKEYLSARDNPAKLLCYGRGMALLSNGFDEVSYQGRGTEINMVKYLTAGC
ncbi:MAG: response regulator [Deltaproteobacteria bacterium]|nr:response regulator [Deltaproteobacteria bacterium]